jgi:ribosome-binding factor A
MQRMRQVNELLRKRIAEIIQREIELPLGVFVTVTSVETSRDLHYAKIFITILPDNRRVSTVEFLQKRHGMIQRALGPSIRMQWTPKLTFMFDEGAIRAQHMYDVMDQLPENAPATRRERRTNTTEDSETESEE